MKTLQNEQGQSVVIIALGLAVLMAFMALAVDGGNIYAQRRQVQNAVDAASSAAGERLARPSPGSNSPSTARATNGQVYNLVKEYLKKNGVRLDGASPNAHNLSVRYITRDSADTDHIDTQEITSYGTGSAAPLRIPVSGGDPVVGVNVQVDKDFNSFFAGIVGIQTMAVGANSPGFGAPIFNNPTPESPPTGACCADDLMPIAMNQALFLDADGDFEITFKEGSPSDEFAIFQRPDTEPNFVFVRWKNDGNDATTLASNISDVTRSGTWYVQEWVRGSGGSLSNGSVRSALNAKIGSTFTLPVFDAARGGNTEFQIVGFARFQLTGVCPGGSGQGNCSVSDTTDSYIQGKFEQWSSSRCESSCAFFGVRTNKPAPPVPQQRALVGVIKLNEHFLENISFTQTPVDVVHVLDTSGSMDRCIDDPNRDCSSGGTSTTSRWKLKAAKDSLITFNGIVSPTLGDKVGLATFPRVVSNGGSSYTMPCRSGTDRQRAYGRNGTTGTTYASGNGWLTSNIASINTKISGLGADGITPIAGGLSIGRQLVLDTANGHVPGHQPVIILASDGLANVTLDGKYTGFDGYAYNSNPCSSQAVTDAIAQANLAKQDQNGDGKPDVILFTIAIGDNFNPDTLEAIASEPSSSHFWQVTSSAAMQDIYSQIAQVLQTGDCTASDQEKFASGAQIQVRNTTTGQTYNATASSTGYFEIRNIDPGTYEFLSATVTIGGFTYDIFTDGVGGPILGDNPTIEVGDAPTTYDVNLALETDDFSGSCP